MAYYIIITKHRKTKLKVLIHYVMQINRRKSIAFLIQKMHRAENGNLLGAKARQLWLKEPQLKAIFLQAVILIRELHVYFLKINK